ncbi:MAG: hypothetical protein NC411_08935 [Bacteroides sp.]|nr:hypothetical protein [Bacteroides sp.]
MNNNCPCCNSSNVSRTFEELIEQTSSCIDKGGIGYQCNNCECLYTVDTEQEDVHIRKYPLTSEVIEQEKRQYIGKLRSKVSYTSFLIYAVISVGLFIYCCVTDLKYQEWYEGNWLISAGYRTAWNYGWLFCGLIFIVTVIIAINKWSRISKQKAEIVRYENMSLDEFKHLHPYLFRRPLIKKEG